MLASALLVVGLAICLEAGLAFAQRVMVPRGVRERSRRLTGCAAINGRAGR
jgi:ABC-type proline/glycine betaine transport system permease subunit